MDAQALNTCLDLVKIDLGITTPAYDARLLQVLESSVRAITDEGIDLDLNDALDIQLLVMYSAWIWNRRRTGEGMPRMVRYALNNRLFRKKGDA